MGELCPKNPLEKMPQESDTQRLVVLPGPGETEANYSHLHMIMHPTAQGDGRNTDPATGIKRPQNERRPAVSWQFNAGQCVYGK